MGYYTNHSLEVWTDSHTVAEIAKAIYDDNDNIFYGIEVPREELLYDTSTDGNFYLPPADMVKWYDCETDMIKFSERFPNALFEICGEGEEQGDVWEMRVKNGMSQTRKQIYCWNRVWSDDFA